MPSEQLLLPCPFCGAEPEIGGPQKTISGNYYWIACSCTAEGPQSTSIASARRLWQARVCVPAVPVGEEVKGWQSCGINPEYPRQVRIIFETPEHATAFYEKFAATPAPRPACKDCAANARAAYSDATTAGFMYDKCEKHRQRIS